MRKLLRSIAHYNMEKEGLTHINHHDYAGAPNGRRVIPSLFAQKWREYVTKEVEKEA